MTSVDKLSKSFEFLKIPVQLYDPEQRKQEIKSISNKDKIIHLNLIYENIISPTVRQCDEHTKMVSLSVETYLNYFDNEDRDVYSVADECLNKTINALLDTNLIRLQYDLYRFIRKNGPVRSLNAALTRFAELSHLIKTHKCRMFVEFLIKENTLSKIASRQEESIQTVLSHTMTSICSAFCWCMTDNEVKTLIQSFLVNLSNESPMNVYRRSSAFCLNTLCLYSRAPYSFYNYLHEELLKLILPLDKHINIFIMWGVLISFRTMIKQISELDRSSSSQSTIIASTTFEHLISSSHSTLPTSPSLSPPTKSFSYIQFSGSNKVTQSKPITIVNLCEIYEVCMFVLNSKDNRIVSSALECLQVLFKTLPFRFNVFLSSPGAMSTSFLSKKQQFIKQSESTNDDNDTENVTNLNFEEIEPVTTPSHLHGKFYNKLTAPIEYFVQYIAFKFLLNTKDYVTNLNVETDSKEYRLSKLKPDNQVRVLIKTIAFDCCTSAIQLRPCLIFYSVYDSWFNKQKFYKNIESENFLDVNDTEEARKNNDENCEQNNIDSSDNSQSSHLRTNSFIYDLFNYVHHTDDKMRQDACQLIGAMIQSVLIEYNGNYEEWLTKMVNHAFANDDEHFRSKVYESLQLEVLIDYLIMLIKFDDQKISNNMCKKAAISSLHSFLPILVHSKYASYSLEIVNTLLHLRHSTYNLVKCELVDLVASIDFKAVNYAENLLASDNVIIKHQRIKRNDLTETNFIVDDGTEYESLNSNPENSTLQNSQTYLMIKNTQEKIVEEVFFYLLGSEDIKLRLETAKSLVRFVSNMSFNNTIASTTNQNILYSVSENEIKSGGYAANLFNTCFVENDACNLNSIGFLFGEGASNSASTSSSSQSDGLSFSSTTKILYAQKKIRYCCSPLSSVSLLSSVPWISKQQESSIINNTFVQPFHSLIKYWPSSASFTNSIDVVFNRTIEQNLSYLVPKLVEKLLQSIDKNQFIGCLEALDFTFQVYSPAIYFSSPISASTKLDSNEDYSQILNLVNLFISLLKHPFVAYDLYSQDILLKLIGTFYSAYSWLNMKKYDKLIQQLNLLVNHASQPANNSQHKQSIQTIVTALQSLTTSTPLPSSEVEQQTGIQYSYILSFNNQMLKNVIDQLFIHTMRMLCLLACIVDETALPTNLTQNLAAGSTSVAASEKSFSNITQSPNSSIEQNSPNSKTNLNESINKKGINLNAKVDNSTKVRNSSQSSGNFNQENKSPLSGSSLPKTATNIYIGFFQNSSYYLKLYETTRISYGSYKKSSKVAPNDRFLEIVKSSLKLFAQLLEVGLGVHELGPHLDEILLYLKVIFAVDPSSAVKCVSMSLKALFSLNLSGLMFEYLQQQLSSSNGKFAKDVENTNHSHSNIDLNSASSVSAPNLLNSFVHLKPSSNKSTNRTSLLSRVISSHLTQFNRFINSPTLMFKNNFDSLYLNYQFLKETESHLQKTASLSSSTSSINSITNIQQIKSNNETGSGSSQTSNNTSIVPGTKATSNFASNLFGMLRKGSSKDAAPILTQQQHQQQTQKELQQKKLKQQKTDTKTITQYIKSFESIVIKSLRQYTFTTSVNLQARILELLVQLVFLKVDYCLLDSDKVFIEYVLKQFDQLEQKRGSDGGISRSASRMGGNATYESNSTLNNIDLSNTDENGSSLLAASYSVDLNENFDSESELSDPLNPFDLDAMLNKVCSKIAVNNGLGCVTSPIVSSLDLKQQEHQRNHLLIPKLFDFLILLSHEKRSSSGQQSNQNQATSVSTASKTRSSYKTGNGILTVPEVIQLCDNLIASENSPHTHAIPALRPLVVDLFLNRSTEDTKELDMQHDVIIKCMLRLIQYPEVWSLLTIVALKYKKENEEKWKKVSRQICDSLFDAMRSSLHLFNNHLRFREYNGYELRAVRRYSRFHVPAIESLKQLFLLLNSLALQAFRPIDFILLSLFEVSRSHLLAKRDLTVNELNNWMCILIVHLYLLLSHNSEEQLLIRLNHLVPEISHSYENLDNDVKFANAFRKASSSSHFTTDSSSESELETDSSNDEFKAKSMPKTSKNKVYFDSDGLEYNEDTSEYDLNWSALYLARFLLRSFEKILTSMTPLVKFNASSTNLAASSGSQLLRDYQLNGHRDLNHTQQLLNNYLLFLMHILNSGSFSKISLALSSLVNNKIDTLKQASLAKTKHTKTSENVDNLFDSTKKMVAGDKITGIQKSPSDRDTPIKNIYQSMYNFNFDHSLFTLKINRLITLKLSKTSPMIASMWQYFLILCNYQESDYWAKSITTGLRKASLKNKQDADISNDRFKIPPECHSDDETSSSLSKVYKHINNYSKPMANNQLFVLNKLHIHHSTCLEKLFQQLSIAIYCENTTNRQQLDNSTSLTMLLMNQLVELFSLANYEPTVLDLFSTIHRNAAASSLFIHCINSQWTQIMNMKSLSLLYACLKSVEAVHLASSGHLLNFLVDKFFNLPYLSLVRYADHIACQRVEMLIEPEKSDFPNQLTEQQLTNLTKFFVSFKYAFRHQRLISLLDQFTVSKSSQDQNLVEEKSTNMPKPIKTSQSMDFFMLYVNNNECHSLDKEWYYNIVRSACCMSSNENPSILNDNSTIKSKQCTIMLSSLDYSNAITIMTAPNFKLTILKDCLLLGAKRTQLTIQKMPIALKQANSSINIEKDFVHPLWSASINFLFDLLNDLCLQLPKPPLISLNNADSSLIYESKLFELSNKYDFYLFISPITETINAYMRCLRQYPSLLNQLTGQDISCHPTKKSTTNAEKINDLITYIIFQVGFVNFISSRQQRILTIHSINESFLCFFNLLLDDKLLSVLCQRPNYSTLVSAVIKDFYELFMFYFFESNDENIIYTPSISSKQNIDYTSKGQLITNDVLFTTNTLDIMLRLRFLITNYRWQSTSSNNGDSELASSMNTSYIVSSNTHRFLQDQSHYFKQKLPFNMQDLVEKIYLSLSRLPILDRFIRIPDVLWRTPGFKLEYSQLLKDDSSALPPLDYLRDPIILKEHLKHILCVGWTSRTQFEYEYVNLLTLLHNLSEDYYPPTENSFVDGQQSQILPSEEIKERNRCICLVVKGLSTWLIKTTLTPKSGTSLNSLYEQVSRNKVPQFLNSQIGKRYSDVKKIIEAFSRNYMFTNINSTSITNNINLLYMLDPTLIYDIDANRQKFVNSLSSHPSTILDSAQPRASESALANLTQISMNLSQQGHNLPFSTNIERTMVANLANNLDTYFYFGQISLEGLLKFLGLWNKTHSSNIKQKETGLAVSFSNFVSSSANINNQGTSRLTVVDEVQNKTVNAFNNFIKVLTEDNPDFNPTYNPSDLTTNNINNSSEIESRDQSQYDINQHELIYQNLQQTQNLDNNLIDPFQSAQQISQLIQRSFNRNNLDLTSVLRTVLDYYESFFRHSCLELKLEIFRSMIYLSNSLYESKQQYESLVNKIQNNFEWVNGLINQEYDEGQLMPAVNDLIDESLLGLGVYGESLSRCCLQTSRFDFSISNKDLERMNRIFDSGLKTTSLSVRIATLHGLMYWLELIALGYFTNNNDAKNLTDHICKQIFQIRDLNVYLLANTRFISTLWSAVFYIIENCLDSIRDAQNFISIFIKQTYIVLNDQNTPYFLFYQLYMGLERLLLSNMIPSTEINTIQKLLNNKFMDEQKSLCVTSLTITSLYASNQSKQINYWNDIVQTMNTPLKPSSSFVTQMVSESDIAQSDFTHTTNATTTTSLLDSKVFGYPQILELSAYPELQSHLLKVLEVATAFLDRLKSSPTAKEASVFASLLPKILCDFLPPHDLLNKLITEFLNSSQHPYPEAVAYILYRCFDILQEKGLQSQIQEWCLLSLTSFLQRTSIYESVWLSSCLLVSATRNQWLKATFPLLLARYCSLDSIDRSIFYMAVIEFCKQFIGDKQQIQQIFESVAKPGTLYAELINLLNF